MNNGKVEWAIWRAGPPLKRYLETENRQQGFVCHSVEGSLASAFSVLDGPRQASWHFTLAKDGTLYQHYRTNASCWASGNFEANSRYVAMESEGTAAAPLTPKQRETAVKLLRELGWTKRGVNLFEHNEVATKWTPNAGPTACPSHRYDAVFAALEEDDDMTPEQEAKLEAVFAALTGGVPGVIEAWNATGNSVIVAYNELVFPHLGHASTLPPGTKFTAEVKE